MVLHNAHAIEYRQQENFWYECAMDAAHWAALRDIAPNDAAMLLCRFNPNEDSYENAKEVTTDELKPKRLEELAQRLTDISRADHRPRTLREWHQTARAIGLAYHSWIDRYMEASAAAERLQTENKQKSVSDDLSQLQREILGAPKAASATGTELSALVAMAGGSASVASDKYEPMAMSALPKQRAQERRILELLRSQGYDPLNLPPRIPGKTGPKSKIKELALRENAIFSVKTFDTAWQRLRDFGDVAEGQGGIP